MQVIVGRKAINHMQNPHPEPPSRKSPILGAIITIFGLLLIGGAAWFAFLAPSSDESQTQATPTIAIADVTPLPELAEVLADDTNVVQESSSGFIYPVNFRIPEIDLDLPVTIVGLNEKNLVTLPPDSVGFWDASTTLAASGNSVLVGHNNLAPQKVFWGLDQVSTGMTIELTSQFGKEYRYTVEEIETIQVEGANESDFRRIADLMKLEDGSERLTIVSCFPAGSCASRIVLIAK